MNILDTYVDLKKFGFEGKAKLTGYFRESGGEIHTSNSITVDIKI